jgi:hypothetical protein
VGTVARRERWALVAAISLLLASCTSRAGARDITVPSGPGPEEQMQVLYAGHGIEVVTTGIYTDAGFGIQPHLYVSSDLVHWRDVTPSGALSGDGIRGDSNVITDASWISSETGWIHTCRPLSYRQGLFQTVNGGRSWQSIPDPDDGTDKCQSRILLLKPGVGIDNLGHQDGLGVTPLEVTDDDGRIWTAPYGIFQGESSVVPDGPIVFANPLDAIAWGGAPMGFGPGIQVSHDAGHTWTSVLPPAPEDPNVRYGFTAFPGAETDLMPVVGVATTGGGTVQLDSSTDGGSTWTIVGRVAFHADPLPPTSYQSPSTTGPSYDLMASLSVTADGAWWLTMPTTPYTTELSTDGGHSWNIVRTTILAGNPDIVPVSRSAALATVRTPTATAGFVDSTVFATTDGGSHWTHIHLPAR